METHKDENHPDESEFRARCFASGMSRHTLNQVQDIRASSLEPAEKAVAIAKSVIAGQQVVAGIMAASRGRTPDPNKPGGVRD